MCWCFKRADGRAEPWGPERVSSQATSHSCAPTGRLAGPRVGLPEGMGVKVGQGCCLWGGPHGGETSSGLWPGNSRQGLWSHQRGPESAVSSQGGEANPWAVGECPVPASGRLELEGLRESPGWEKWPRCRPWE